MSFSFDPDPKESRDWFFFFFLLLLLVDEALDDPFLLDNIGLFPVPFCEVLLCPRLLCRLLSCCVNHRALYVPFKMIVVPQ